MSKRTCGWVAAAAGAALAAASGCEAPPETSLDNTGSALSVDHINAALAASGYDIAIHEIEYFTIGNERPSDRFLQLPHRWVPGDARRAAQGNDLTYLVDQSNGATSAGLTSAETEAAIDRSMATWNESRPLQSVELVKRPDPGTDATIVDGLWGHGDLGNPFAADVVSAGFYPPSLFEAVGGPGGADNILAFSATFVFIDEAGTPTDINNDGYLDVAFNEVYYNDNFGLPGGPRAGNPWAIDGGMPTVDVETVALHENGHSLGAGHFGPPPSGLMNPIYSGIQQAPSPTDLAAMHTLWSHWPN